MSTTEITLIVSNVLTIGGVMYLIAKPQDPNVVIVDDCSNIQTDNPARLSAGMAKALVTNYKNNQLAVINQSGPQGSSDARSAWLSLSAMKKFICELEKTSLENLNMDASQLGVRIYYGAYPQAGAAGDWSSFPSTLPDGTPTTNYAGKHTIVMVPTYNTVNAMGVNVNVDFDPRFVTVDPGTLKAAPKAMRDILSNPGEIVMMQDHTSLAPPPDDLARVGNTLLAFADAAQTV
jgi:hypothetical protein